jgi:hypothetical protein
MNCIGSLTSEIIFNSEYFLNVVKPDYDNVGAESRLVDYIRDSIGLTGTKYCCREGNEIELFCKHKRMIGSKDANILTEL